MPRIGWQAILFTLLASYLYSLLRRPDLLIVGSFTHDIVGGSVEATRPVSAVLWGTRAPVSLSPARLEDSICESLPGLMAGFSYTY